MDISITGIKRKMDFVLPSKYYKLPKKIVSPENFILGHPIFGIWRWGVGLNDDYRVFLYNQKIN